MIQLFGRHPVHQTRTLLHKFQHHAGSRNSGDVLLAIMIHLRSVVILFSMSSNKTWNKAELEQPWGDSGSKRLPLRGSPCIENTVHSASFPLHPFPQEPLHSRSDISHHVRTRYKVSQLFCFQVEEHAWDHLPLARRVCAAS